MQNIMLTSVRLDRLPVSYREAVLTMVEEDGVVVRWNVDIEEADHELFGQNNNRFRFWLDSTDSGGQMYKGPCMIESVSMKGRFVKLSGTGPLVIEEI
ncbi:hypothetical protein ACFOLK_09530 [Marinococcus halophilus]|uniref:Uncharacterized protein n=1 Tax=Marinococcus halophilus TaxID=1371 RepID=A0A510Y4C6_MARHA|nr:hypothetical protein [Marinococcus halophilus]GEK58190.1 hypothetical protein MHA01_10950 [Marinococcus halophilus]